MRQTIDRANYSGESSCMILKSARKTDIAFVLARTVIASVTHQNSKPLSGRKRMIRPCRREIQKGLKQVVFFAVREALNAPAHPDSKRQERRKRRDLERYGARVLKREYVVSCPDASISKRQQRHEMKMIILRDEREKKEFARKVAERLLGKVRYAF